MYREIWNPLTEMNAEVSRIFGNFSGFSEAQQFVPACEVAEDDNHYTLTLELAGVKKEDIKLEAVERKITVAGERRREKSENGKYSEFKFGKFSRSFTLPTHVDTSKIEADFKDGVLSVTIPKAESVKPRQIPIQEKLAS